MLMRETNDRHEITHVKHLMPFWKIYSYKILFAFELEQMHSRDRLFFDIHHVFITYPEHDIINNVCKKRNLLLLHRKWKLILWIHGKFIFYQISNYWNEIRKYIQDLYYFYVYGFDLNNNWIFSHRLDGFVVADVINLQDIKHSKFRPF